MGIPGALTQDPINNRPIAGITVFNENSIDLDKYNFDQLVKIFVHELTHALFFAPVLFINYYPKYGGKVFFFEDEQGTPMIRGPNILKKVREHFACPSVEGGTRRFRNNRSSAGKPGAPGFQGDALRKSGLRFGSDDFGNHGQPEAEQNDPGSRQGLEMVLLQPGRRRVLPLGPRQGLCDFRLGLPERRRFRAVRHTGHQKLQRQPRLHDRVREQHFQPLVPHCPVPSQLQNTPDVLARAVFVRRRLGLPALLEGTRGNL